MEFVNKMSAKFSGHKRTSSEARQKKWSSLVQIEDHLILHSLVVVGNDLVVVPHKVMGFNQDKRTLAGDVVNDLHKEPLN